AGRAVANVIAERRPELLGRVRRRRHSAGDAEDLLHSAFARALERADQLRDPQRAEAWVGRVVENAVLDDLRRPSAPVMPSDEAISSPLEGDGPSCACVLAQVKHLRPADAELLQRVVVDGVPITHVAAELGLSPNAAMVRLHRARAALVERLRSHCGTTTLRGCIDCGCEERGCCATVPAGALQR
ncbi:MAG TPA: sigma-70 family RNA polymerase sigma factor, partial [Polyangiaceae bacterium]|nr:sigma-70 family RNA polymerase sigma factor [Polyangiaceae bacterium]